MTFRLRFGAPRANWIPLGVASESIAFDELVSAAPADPLAGIARAALAAAQGQPGSTVLYAGPEEYVLSFAPWTGGVQLDIVRWPDHGREPGAGARVFRKRGGVETVLVPVWRGLRELGGRWPATPSYWRSPFPQEAVARLGAALGAS